MCRCGATRTGILFSGKLAVNALVQGGRDVYFNAACAAAVIAASPFATSPVI